MNTPGVLGNDSDPDNGDTITASLVSGPSHAVSFTLNADGSFSYTPSSNYNGNDSFTYKAVDSHNAESNVATVNITINAVNDPPSITGGAISARKTAGAPTRRSRLCPTWTTRPEVSPLPFNRPRPGSQ